MKEWCKMNLKAEKFKAYIAENNITNFKVEESINNNEEENSVQSRLSRHVAELW